MLFTTLEFAEFFSVVFAVSWAIARWRRLRILFLVAASYVFYARWDYRFLPLIFLSSTADWLLGDAIGRARDPRERRFWLVVTVILNLGILGFFKYANFGIETARAILARLGYHPPELALSIVLPVGVSFFTFESMSYVIDVYRGDIEPHPSYLEYLAFVAFFPHLIAGPIVRPRALLPQLAAPARWEEHSSTSAVFLICVGLVKKVGISDVLALGLVDRVFESPSRFSGLECYAAVLGYAVQIYCDFSGYTDMAIGCARLLGIELPLNFDAPYKAMSPRDFWRRWHISLSTWLRDYLYISLGGNRRGALRTYVNLLVTMLLGGLWHGASFTFVVWGGIHGVGLAVNRFLGEAREPSLLRRLLSTALTFHFVCFAWIFFRATTFHDAATLLHQLGTLTTSRAALTRGIVTVLGLGLASHFVPESFYRSSREAFSRLPAPAQGAVLVAIAFFLTDAGDGGGGAAAPFLYFQF